MGRYPVVDARPVLLLVAIGATTTALAAACGSSERISSDGSSVLRRDSAGIRVVESAAPAWADAHAWTIDPDPDVVIGAAPLLKADAVDSEAVPLERVQAVRILSDGRILVADDGAAQVLIFDDGGRLSSRIGSKGEGPGEFRGISNVHTCAGDTIVVADGWDAHLFDPEGRFLRRATYRAAGTRTGYVGISADCSRALIRWNSDEPPPGRLGLVETTFGWMDLETEAVDTLARAFLFEGWTREFYSEIGTFAVPWGAAAYTYAQLGDTLVVGHGRTAEIRRYDPAGRLLSLTRWADRPRPVTRADRRRYEERRRESLAGMPDHPESRFWYPKLDEFPELPTHKPLFDRILADDEGGLWLRASPPQSCGDFDGRLQVPPPTNRRWIVLAADGAWLGEVALPDRFDLHAVARGRIYGVVEDSLDVQTVQVFRIRKSAGPAT